MKKIIIFAFCMVSLAFNANAQFSEDLKTIEVGMHSTTHVLFTSDLTYVNITRPQEVKTMIVPASKNMLALTALVEFNTPTTFSVLEANGNIHTFLLKYNPFPAELLVDTRENAEAPGGQMNTQVRPSTKTEVTDSSDVVLQKSSKRGKKSSGVMNVASSQTSNFSKIDAPTLEEVVKSPQKIFHIGDRTFNVHAYCTNIYVYSNLLYLVVSIDNLSDIGFEAGDAQFTIETRTKKRQYLESDKDVWAKSTYGTLSCAPKGKTTVGFTIPKFTLLKKECLRIYVYEKNGNRNLVLTLTDKDINYALAYSN